MLNLKQRLSEMNGWQRMWFVSTVLLLIWGGLIMPMHQSEKGSMGRYQYKWAVEKDIENPQCKEYFTEPFHKLKEPDYTDGGGSCWHVFTHREINLDGKPFKPENYEKHFAAEEREILLTYAGLGLVVAAVISAMVYAAGWAIGWIFVGFRKQGKTS